MGLAVFARQCIIKAVLVHESALSEGARSGKVPFNGRFGGCKMPFGCFRAEVPVFEGRSRLHGVVTALLSGWLSYSCFNSSIFTRSCAFMKIFKRQEYSRPANASGGQHSGRDAFRLFALVQFRLFTIPVLCKLLSVAWLPLLPRRR